MKVTVSPSGRPRSLVADPRRRHLGTDAAAPLESRPEACVTAWAGRVAPWNAAHRINRGEWWAVPTYACVESEEKKIQAASARV